MKTLQGCLFSLLWALISANTFAQQQDIGGCWTNPNAKSNEPLMIIIDEAQQLLQLIPQNYKGDYAKLATVSFRKARDFRKEGFEANTPKYRLYFYEEGFPSELVVKIQKKSPLLSQRTADTYEFTKRYGSRSNFDSEGSIYFTNHSYYNAALYLKTRKAELLVAEIPSGQVHLQPTQKGMNWMVKVNGREELNIKATGRHNEYQDIGDRVIARGALRGGNPSHSADEWRYGQNSTYRQNEASLESSIWVNKGAKYGQLETLIIDDRLENAAGFDKGDRYSGSRDGRTGRIEQRYTGTYSVNVSGLNIEFEVGQSIGFDDEEVLMVAERRQKPNHFEKLTYWNSEGTMAFTNRLRRPVNIYCMVNGRKIRLSRLESGDFYTQPTLEEMEWRVEDGNGYQKTFRGKSGRQDIEIEETGNRAMEPRIFQETHPVKFDETDNYFYDNPESPNPEQPTTIMLGNSRNHKLLIYARNSQGQPEFMGTINPGDVTIFKTFIGQTWEARISQRNGIGTYTVIDKRDRKVFE